MQYKTPHGDKLRALLDNDKLPVSDQPGVRGAIERYQAWIQELDGLRGQQSVEPFVASLNCYKKFIDLELIYDSDEDFLYRQKGQLKLDNTVLEEFLPRLVGNQFSERIEERGLIIGPANALAQIRFDSDLRGDSAGGGIEIRAKDHDFAVVRPLFLQASHHEDFSNARGERTQLAYIAAEIKTNLDKTMFQEASATAQDLKVAVPNSRYFLLCEWLDMTPISTDLTAIEEVIVLRRARRLSADLRGQFSSVASRVDKRDAFERHLNQHPLDPSMFRRFLSHLERLLGSDEESEQDTLNRGWF